MPFTLRMESGRANASPLLTTKYPYGSGPKMVEFILANQISFHYKMPELFPSRVY